MRGIDVFLSNFISLVDNLETINVSDEFEIRPYQTIGLKFTCP